MDDQLSNYSRLEDNNDNLLNHKQELNTFLEDVSAKILKLYSSSFKLIDMYGEFYVLTERIWVTCDNIFRLFQRRAKEIDRAMSQNHFGILETSARDIKLLRMEFSELNEITRFPLLKTNYEYASYLMCSLSVRVVNPDMKYLGTEFELRMVVNNRIAYNFENRFAFKVDSTEQMTRIYDTFMLEPGSNQSKSFCIINYWLLIIDY